ncbi:CRTAC1 family protein [Sulfidibacter corallicola]|uniref:CRTAC1 family protein n=1 Tax=Sulfidibacter corallicola TaxID=2818388 RepID=A0A8A4TH07_SULCO|nr:CRTAC1 family protein [Sulfidibacter corallicola]QTD49206.1 CRTAC1 family protein [Sulfidibacter corallicola]
MTCLLLAGFLLWQGTGESWTFTEVTESAGIRFEHRYSGNTEPEYISGGVAVADVDRDGDEDLFFVSGSQGANALYRNNGDGTFTDIAEAAGVALPERFDCGPVFADFTADGWPDLFLGGIQGSKPLLLANNGDGTFRDVTTSTGITAQGDTFGGVFGDIDRDGDLDLFLAFWTTQHEGYLWRNNGDGTFTSIDEAAGIAEALVGVNAFAPGFADLNGDHWPDLVVVADFKTSTYFLNQGDGRFVEGDRSPITDANGMGSALGDYDNDGDLDWFVTSISPVEGNPNTGSTGNRLYRNRGDGTFEDATDEAGVREGHWGWGATFGDLDNDGDLDLCHVNGFFGNFAQGYDVDPSKLFVNVGGRFEERSASLGLVDTAQGRGVACLDYDLDGDLDLIVANNQGSPKLFRNDGHGEAHYLKVRLQDRSGNRDALGARVTIQVGDTLQVREIGNGNQFVSHNPAEAHFGLGAATRIDLLTVTWPDGARETHADIEVDRKLVLTREQAPNQGCGTATTRVLPHVTRPGNGFHSELLISNHGSLDAVVDVVAYGTGGEALAMAAIDVDVAAFTRVALASLFGDAKVSHLTLTAPREVVSAIQYRHDLAANTPAQVRERRSTAHAFEVVAGNGVLTFDGLALVNFGDGAAAVTASLLDDRGVALEEAILDAALAPRAKVSAVFSDFFQSDLSGRRVRITSDQPAHALFLRGTHPGIEPGLLFEVASTGQTE